MSPVSKLTRACGGRDPLTETRGYWIWVWVLAAVGTLPMLLCAPWMLTVHGVETLLAWARRRLWS